MGQIEGSDFYYCIRWCLYAQIIGGGRIQRPKSEHLGLSRYYGFNVYCIICNVMTCCGLCRLFFYFGVGFSIEANNILANLVVVFYITVGATQLASFFTYPRILPFWDSLLSTTPNRFSGELFRPKIAIQCILAFEAIYVIAIYFCNFYGITQPDLDPIFIRLAEPWSHPVTKARISFMVTFVCFLPAFITWASCSVFFATGAYYLRAGFIDLHKTMYGDPQMVSHMSSYKKQHMRLAELTETFHGIVKVHIGASITMAAVDMCFVVSTIGDDYRIMALLGSISVIGQSLFTLLVVSALSISINSWVIAEFLYF